MKKMFCLLVISAMLCACLPAALAAGDELQDVRCDEWHFSVRIPEEIHISPVSFEDWENDAVIAGGLKLSGGAEDDFSWIQVIRRSRIYDNGGYLCGLESYLYDYGEIEVGEFTVDSFGGRALYGSTGIVYGEQGKELFREIRLIPVSDNRGTEFAARYTAETEAAVLSLLDTVIRNYQPDEETKKAEAAFLPESHRAGQDLQNGEFLFRTEDADKIETDGYFTAVLYLPDWYSSEDVHAMRPGDTILIMDRVLTITGIDPCVDDDGSWYEADLYATDNTLTEEHFAFTLIPTED